MKIEVKNINSSLNKAFLAQRPFTDEISLFKENFTSLLKSIKPNDNEETLKDYINDFLKNTYYKGKFSIKENVNNIDLVIYTGIEENDKIGVIIETKALKNNAEMITTNEFNKKALQELIQYYLEERISNDNVGIKHLIITNSIEWFIFNSTEFERIFYQNKDFLKIYNDWITGKLVNKNKDWFYSEIAKQFIEKEQETIFCTHFKLPQLADFEKLSDIQVIEFYKIFSPEHLLKLPFQNDSNTLNREFYTELLHIIGLQETKDKIQRLPPKHRNEGSLLENTISVLEQDEILSKIPQPSQYGDTKEEQLFSIGLELCITWLNRILFLKLLESQLIKYNKNKSFAFLNIQKIKDFDDLKELFFEILAVPANERKHKTSQKYLNIPYLNSSLFEQNAIEKETIRINQLKHSAEIPLFHSTIIKNENGKRITENWNTLKYIFEFLDSFNFASDNKIEIQEQNKTIINSSVLGLIFEKINGYKEGSFYTPGYITMYICRETIRNAVIQKFKESKLPEFKTIKNFKDLYNSIGKIKIEKANEIFNSLLICDPAVGSGHFLVSALNELIAIKSELEILTDKEGKTLRNTYCEVESDELFITYKGETYIYDFKDKESQRIQETIFLEKQKLIENCLFGVDINPKSVNICRLRLWIELLKNAYYKQDTGYKELETLPNIDINIKCGNSLINHFTLNGNGVTNGQSQKLKQFTQKYKEKVYLYKNSKTKAEKQVLENFINECKEYFSRVVKPNDNDLKKLREIESEIGSTPMFFNHEDQVQWELKLMQLNKEKNEVETKYEEKKKEIYFNSFEWRFEFPEVLDDNGYFIGFDVIIGNPPYIEIRDVKEHFKNFYNFIYPEQKNSFDLYSLFIQRSLSLLKANSQLAFIVPRPILYNSTFKPIRKLIFENSLNQIYLPEKLVFEKAFVETVILFISKNKKEGKTLLIRSANKEIISNISDGNFAGSPIIIGDSYVTNIINKLNKNKKLSDFVDIIRGLELGKNTIKHQTEENDKNVKIFAGEAIQKYTFFEDKTILVKKHDLESFLKNTNKKFLQYPRIVLRRVAQEPIVTILAQGEDFLNNLNSVYNLAVTNTKISNEFLVGVLNSNLIKFYIQKSFSSDEKLFPYLRIEQLKEIPIVLASDKQQEPIIKLVKQIYELKKQNQNVNILELETKIDEFVFKLYDLSNEEVINIKKEI